MLTSDFQFIANFLRDLSGLMLTPGKEYLVESRLAPILRDAGLRSISQLVQQLREDPDSPLGEAVIEAMTTNETLFFRDRKPFEELRDTLLPRLIAARQTTRTLRLWSCACSTGQEPYSLNMLLNEHFPELAHWKVEILATDISREALQYAQQGSYTRFEVQRGLPIQMLMKYFDQNQSHWVVKPALRSRIRWMKWNLLDCCSHLGHFDLILCRNVLIYFGEETKAEVLNRLCRQCRPEGYLILGATETLLGNTYPVERIARGVSGIYAPATSARNLERASACLSPRL